jgi:hypothetical protein
MIYNTTTAAGLPHQSLTKQGLNDSLFDRWPFVVLLLISQGVTENNETSADD